MAFINEQFPSVKLVHGVKKSIIDPVAVVTNGNQEFRIKKNRFPRFNWEIPSANVTEETKLEMNAFLAAKDHSLDSFKFSDPDQVTLTDGLMLSKSGSDWYFNIPFDSTTTGNHPIFHSDNLTATRNGSPATISGTSVVDGLPIITITGSSPGDVIKITGEIFFAVRLDSATGWSLQALNGDNTPNIIGYSTLKLIEVFET